MASGLLMPPLRIFYAPHTRGAAAGSPRYDIGLPNAAAPLFYLLMRKYGVVKIFLSGYSLFIGHFDGSDLTF